METVFALDADASDSSIHSNSNTDSKNGNTSNSSRCSSSSNNNMYNVPDQARPWCWPGSGYSTELLFERKN